MAISNCQHLGEQPTPVGQGRSALTLPANFGHGQGLVPRDLKPSNVWLTVDGTIMLGGLGLAVQMGVRASPSTA